MAKLSIVMYHYVRPIADSVYPGIKGLEFALFKQQIQFFKENFHTVTMEQVIDSIQGTYQLPERAVLLTFDDGYIDHYKYVFPVLKEYGMQGSFFVPSGILKYGKVLDVNKIHFILACADMEKLLPEVFGLLQEYRNKGYSIEADQILFEKLAVANRWDTKETIFIKRLLQTYLNEKVRGEIVDRLFLQTVGVSEKEFSKQLYVNMDQIKEMREAGMYFGLHGESHYWLNHLTVDKMKQDIDNALAFFASVMNKEYLAMNYPYGGYNQEVLDYVAAIGCKVGFSVEARHVNLRKDHVLALPRLDTNDFPPKSERWRELD